VDSDRTFDVRLEGWEQFHSPVDRIVSIEANFIDESIDVSLVTYLKPGALSV